MSQSNRCTVAIQNDNAVVTADGIATLRAQSQRPFTVAVSIASRSPRRVLGALVAVALTLVGLLGTGCKGPTYPSCDNDEQCTKDGRKGVCVNHTCVECRSNAECGAGKECLAGACATITNYCDDSTPCSSGTCRNNRCEAATPLMSREPVQCDDDHPCTGTGERCQNNHCVGPIKGGPGCDDFPAPRFEFESQELIGDARTVLERLARCVTSGSLKGARILLTGHCDARGENEFNMSLGAQRAEAARSFLVGLGVNAKQVSTSSRGELDASGKDESGWSNDRRVDIEVR